MNNNELRKGPQRTSQRKRCEPPPLPVLPPPLPPSISNIDLVTCRLNNGDFVSWQQIVATMNHHIETEAMRTRVEIPLERGESMACELSENMLQQLGPGAAQIIFVQGPIPRFDFIPRIRRMPTATVESIGIVASSCEPMCICESHAEPMCICESDEDCDECPYCDGDRSVCECNC